VGKKHAPGRIDDGTSQLAVACRPALPCAWKRSRGRYRKDRIDFTRRLAIRSQEATMEAGSRRTHRLNGPFCLD
jgi:hypothetical protein